MSPDDVREHFYTRLRQDKGRISGVTTKMDAAAAVVTLASSID